MKSKFLTYIESTADISPIMRDAVESIYKAIYEANLSPDNMPITTIPEPAACDHGINNNEYFDDVKDSVFKEAELAKEQSAETIDNQQHIVSGKLQNSENAKVKKPTVVIPGRTSLGMTKEANGTLGGQSFSASDGGSTSTQA